MMEDNFKWKTTFEPINKTRLNSIVSNPINLGLPVTLALSWPWPAKTLFGLKNLLTKNLFGPKICLFQNFLTFSFLDLEVVPLRGTKPCMQPFSFLFQYNGIMLLYCWSMGS